MIEKEKVTIYTVTEITKEIRSRLESDYPEIWIEAEVSNVRLPTSGHLYFTLKDPTAQIQAVCFHYHSRPFAFDLKEGAKVLVKGNITVYERGGNYQVNIRVMEPAGVGALQMAIEALKKKLFAEGLFDETQKKPIPRFPLKIGVVTSPSGAAIRDILNTLDRRFSRMHVIIAPCLVQGLEAPPQIVGAIQLLNQMKEVDTIIVTRGGGSLEDLMAFNDESVARAIFNSKIPILSAIGHEIDWTISDFVSDLRVATPTAAAEMVVVSEGDIAENLQQFEKNLHFRMKATSDRLRESLNAYRDHYVFREPQRRIDEFSQGLDHFQQQINRSMNIIVQIRRESLRRLAEKSHALSPLATLERGYSLTRKGTQAALLTDVKKLKKGDQVQTQLSKGSFVSTVDSVL